MSDRSEVDKEGFAALTQKLARDVLNLAGETYNAPKKGLSSDALQDLISRADAQVAEYESLLEKYTGGQLKSIQRSQPDVEQLKVFTDKLRRLQSNG